MRQSKAFHITVLDPGNTRQSSHQAAYDHLARQASAVFANGDMRCEAMGQGKREVNNQSAMVLHARCPQASEGPGITQHGATAQSGHLGMQFLCLLHVMPLFT